MSQQSTNEPFHELREMKEDHKNEEKLRLIELYFKNDLKNIEQIIEFLKDK